MIQRTYDQLLIRPPTIFSDLSDGASEGFDINLDNHGSFEVPEKGFLIDTIGSNLRICRSSIKQLLVGVEKSTFACQIIIGSNDD